MTARDKQRLQRLEAENRMLRDKLAEHMRVYSDCLAEIIELKARLELVRSSISGE